MALPGIKNGKPGGKSVGTGAGSSPTTSGGGPGKSLPQKPIPGPSKPGMPIAMKKALRRK